MITKQEAMELLHDFIRDSLANEDWYKQVLSDIYAVLLYGSVAKESHRSDSDIDMLIVLPLEVEQAYTVGEYFYDYKGYEINIALRSIERLRLIAQAGPDAFQLEVFRDAEILFAQNDEVANLLQKIANH